LIAAVEDIDPLDLLPPLVLHYLGSNRGRVYTGAMRSRRMAA